MADWPETGLMGWDDELRTYIDEGDAAAGAVTSVNGETGIVVLDAVDVGAATTGHTHDYPVDSVNGETGVVSLSAADVGAATTGHTHDYPVDSVNGETGIVVLDAVDVGAATTGHTHDYPVDSVNGETGVVSLSAADVSAIPAGDVTIIDVMTQAAYDALTPKVATTLYLIVG